MSTSCENLITTIFMHRQLVGNFYSLWQITASFSTCKQLHVFFPLIRTEWACSVVCKMKAGKQFHTQWHAAKQSSFNTKHNRGVNVTLHACTWIVPFTSCTWMYVWLGPRVMMPWCMCLTNQLCGCCPLQESNREMAVNQLCVLPTAGEQSRNGMHYTLGLLYFRSDF
jgi:hypothetical protein